MKPIRPVNDWRDKCRSTPKKSQVGGTELALRHRVVGMIDPSHREGVTLGWKAYAKDVKRMAE